MKRTDINTMLCAERLKELRMAHSFTQKQIGDLIGVSRATVSRYETGTHSLCNKKLRRLSP